MKEVFPGDSVHSLLSILDVITVAPLNPTMWLLPALRQLPALERWACSLLIPDALIPLMIPDALHKLCPLPCSALCSCLTNLLTPALVLCSYM